ncbi:MAG: Gfo/Idh/MocA family oxidoreductase, partial [Acidobacteria bacterium]|nr:Gfo/Idh/MocA family oxidoreductase [Acidobacteriota bacterium]
PAAVRGSQANSKISVGLIGSGHRGSYDASLVNADPRARITALCDLFDDQIERAKQTIKVENPAVYKDFQKLLASDVDAVFIATPVFEHPRMLEAAVQARKHIYCEKPAGANLEGCRKVIAAGKRADPKKCLSFGFQQRSGPVYTAAYKALKNGDIGEITMARAYWIGGSAGVQKRSTKPRVSDPDPKINRLRNWYGYKDLSGDFIVEQDCHNFDDLHWFLDALPIRAAGYGGRKLRTDEEIFDHLSLTFEFPNGVHVAYEATQIAPPSQSRVGEEYSGSNGGIMTSRKKSLIVRGAKPETIVAKRDITLDHVENFLGRILSGDVENVAERSAQSTMIALLGRAAMYSGREATWKGEFGA